MDDRNQPTVPAGDAPVGDQGGQPAWTPPAETPAVDPNAPVVPPAPVDEPAPVAEAPVVEQPVV